MTTALPTRDAASDGRLLGYFPDDNLCDGAAAVASESFFDDDNIPPWETWVTLVHVREAPISFRRCLIAWIPRMFVPRANAGVQVNPEECIRWLDGDLDDIRDIVRRAARM
ncbi:MAG TPA: hypothetical protein VGO00_12480 [Kofleriaceae bacterium]|nr:hypothetical protein [Kofleriaceae bacterium]